MRTTNARRGGHLRVLIAGVSVLALSVAACSSTEKKTETQPTTSAPVAAPSAAPGAVAPAAVKTGLVSYASDKPFQATVDALRQAVSANGMMILGEVDQAKALSQTGLQLEGAHSFFVGNPSMGKMFFQKNPAIGAVIPLRMSVWASGGKASVTYFDPEAGFTAVDPGLADGGRKMSDKAAMIAKAATGGSAGQPGAQQDAKFISVDAKEGFPQTVDALKQAVSANGMMILGELDQAKALTQTGLELQGAHTLLVGNPSMGKMFFQKTPAIGAVIPLRIYAWVDQAGATHVGYFDPQPLFVAVDPGLSDGGQKMAQKAAMITDAVKKPA